MNGICFESEDFLDDVKYQIKRKHGNQENYAKKIGCSRKTLNRLLNCRDYLTIHWFVKFCNDLDMNAKAYITER